MTTLFVVLGALLLGLLAIDVFLTVFAVEGSGGPLTMREARLVWAGFRAFARGRSDRVRERVLAFGGPTIVALNFLTWVGLLVLGYALIYLPFLRTDFIFATGHLRVPFWEALYFSAQAAPTLGTGDMVPDAQWLRIVEVLESMTGFAVVTSSITYLLAVYEELIAMHTTAVIIANYFSDGLTRTLRRLEKAGASELATWSEDIGAGVVRALQAHYQYPIVHYFRVSARSRAFAVQIGRLLDLRRAIAEGRPSAELAEELSAHPSYRALAVAIREFLNQVELRFVPARFMPRLAEHDEQDLEPTYARLLAYLYYDDAAKARSPDIGAEANR